MQTLPSGRRAATWGLVLFVAASVWLTYHAHRLADSLDESSEDQAGLQGKSAPDFSLPLLTVPGSGQPARAGRVALADQRGQIVFVSFWASWCRPCDFELPLLNQFYLAHRDQGVQVVAISTDMDRNAALRYAQERAFAFPMVWDRGGQVAELYQTDALPTLVVIDRAGTVRQVQVGLRVDLESWLQRQVRVLSRQAARGETR